MTAMTTTERRHLLVKEDSLSPVLPEFYYELGRKLIGSNFNALRAVPNLPIKVRWGKIYARINAVGLTALHSSPETVQITKAIKEAMRNDHDDCERRTTGTKGRADM